MHGSKSKLMRDVRFVRLDDDAQFAVVPIDLWNQLCTSSASQENTDAVGVPATTSESDAPDPAPAPARIQRTPAAVTSATPDGESRSTAGPVVNDGEHPLRAWRRFRRLSTISLSNAVDVAPSYVTLIETRKRRGSSKVFRRIARVLGAPAAALTEDPRQAAELALADALEQAEDAVAPDVHPLRAWRLRRELTVQALADAAGLYPSHVTLIETGRRNGSVAVFERLGDVLDAPAASLSKIPLEYLRKGKRKQKDADETMPG
ncbi:helix-turn-helix domain-containing protein [Paraburkholderia sp. SIMBA_054]|uniref:helix-turn-helix domain-containing protein n=1 Tax=Paraburkholderia sp. SIMBA_054 TaxID=3085795 RepID=UPI003979C79B